VEAQDAIRQGLAQPNRAFNSYEDLKSIAPAIQDAETLDVTEYALDQLENEREKNHFLTEISRQLQFDYNKSLDLLHIPVWAAKRLGTPAQIKDPLHTEALANLISHDLVELLSKAITETTPQDPLVRLDCTVTSNGEAYDCIIITKTVYVRMLTVASRSGSLDDILIQLSSLFFNESVSDIDEIIDSVEPIMAAFLTVAVGATLISVMLPLIGVMGSIS
jgi:hypothetical protein